MKTSEFVPPVTLEAFLDSPEAGDRHELVNGAVLPKMSPKRFHSRVQRALLYLLDEWGERRGEVGVEWAVVLERDGQPWVPVPDLLYVAGDRLPKSLGDEPCPVPPDLAIEIISPGQAFGDVTDKAISYLAAGVGCVWVVDARAQSVVVFHPDTSPAIVRGDRPIASDRLPDLTLTPAQIFAKAGLTDAPEA